MRWEFSEMECGSNLARLWWRQKARSMSPHLVSQQPLCSPAGTREQHGVSQSHPLWGGRCPVLGLLVVPGFSLMPLASLWE